MMERSPRYSILSLYTDDGEGHICYATLKADEHAQVVQDYAIVNHPGEVVEWRVLPPGFYFGPNHEIVDGRNE